MNLLDIAEETGVGLGDFLLRLLGIKRNTYVGDIAINISTPKTKKLPLGIVGVYKSQLALLNQKAINGDWSSEDDNQFIHLQSLIQNCYGMGITDTELNGNYVWVEGKCLDPAWPIDQQIWGQVKLKAYREGVFEGIPLYDGGFEKMNQIDFMMLGTSRDEAKSFIEKGLSIADLHEKPIFQNQLEREGT